MHDFTTLFFWGLASVGLTAILVDGKVFQPLRESFRRQAEKVERKRERGKSIGWNFGEWADKVLGCYQCCGFWSGLFCALLLFTLPFFLATPWASVNAQATLAEQQLSYPKLSLRVGILHAVYLLCCGWAASLLSVLFMMLLDTARSMNDYYRSMTPMQNPEQAFPETPHPVDERESPPIDEGRELEVRDDQRESRNRDV